MAHLSNIEGIEMEGKLPEVRLASTPFKVVSPYEPAGDQPQAIEKLATGVKEGLRYQNLLGVTGSGKTFTMAKVIEAVQKPTLVMAPNKTLAAQLASELKEFFPDNAVVYFVSYYDYYQPEAYVPKQVDKAQKNGHCAHFFAPPKKPLPWRSAYRYRKRSGSEFPVPQKRGTLSSLRFNQASSYVLSDFADLLSGA